MIKNSTIDMFLTAIIALALAICVMAFSGCSEGDDDTTCMAVENCPDAGNPTTADADTLAPDADTSPDANGDPCAAYAQYAGQTWNCAGSFSPTDCTIQLGVQDGACYIFCLEACWPPSQMDMASGHFVCTTFSNAQQECWR